MAENKYFCVKITYKDYVYKFDIKYSDKVLNDYIVYEIGENFNEKHLVKESLRLFLNKEFSKSRHEREVFRHFYERYKSIFDSVSKPVYDKGDVVTLRSTISTVPAKPAAAASHPAEENDPPPERRTGNDNSYTQKIEELLEGHDLKLDDAFEKYNQKLYEMIEQQYSKLDKMLDSCFSRQNNEQNEQESVQNNEQLLAKFENLLERQGIRITEALENQRIKMDEITENQRLMISKLDKYQRDFEDFEYKFEGIEKAIDNIKKILEAVESIPGIDNIREILDDMSAVPPPDSKVVGEAKKIIVDLVSQLAAGTDEYIKTIDKTS